MWSVILIANIEMDVQAKRKRARTPTPGEYLGVRGMLISLFILDPVVITNINMYPYFLLLVQGCVHFSVASEPLLSCKF